jgi:hypothetical protein
VTTSVAGAAPRTIVPGGELPNSAIMPTGMTSSSTASQVRTTGRTARNQICHRVAQRAYYQDDTRRVTFELHPE